MPIVFFEIYPYPYLCTRQDGKFWQALSNYFQYWPLSHWRGPLAIGNKFFLYFSHWLSKSKSILYFGYEQVTREVFLICALLWLSNKYKQLVFNGAHFIIVSIMRAIVYFIVSSAAFINMGLSAKQAEGYPDCLRSIAPAGEEIWGTFQFIHTQQIENDYPIVSPYNYTKIKQTVMNSHIETGFSAYVFIFGVVTAIFLVTRFFTANQLIFKECSIKNCGPFSQLGIIVISLFSPYIYASLYTSQNVVVQSIRQAQCAARYFPQLMVYGDNSSNWAGYDRFIRLIELQKGYLNTISQMPSEYDFFLQPIQSRVGPRLRFLKQWPDANGQAVWYDDSAGVTQTVDYKTILPQYFDSKKDSWRKKMENINDKFLNMTKQIVIIEQLHDQIKVGANDAINSLMRKLKSFNMARDFLLKIDKWENRLDNYRQGSETVFNIMEIFIGVGLGNSMMFPLVVCILAFFKAKSIYRLFNVLWFLLMLQLVGSGIAYYVLVGPTLQLRSIAKTYQLVIRDSSYFYQHAYSTDPNKKLNESIQIPHTYFRIHQDLQPCLFGDGNFTKADDPRQDTRALTYYMSNLKDYLDKLNNTLPQFIDYFEFDTVYTNLEKQMKQKKYDNTAKWPYINTLIQKLNNETQKNLIGTDCYKHRWVYQIKNCPNGSYIHNSQQLTKLIIAQGNYNKTTLQCMVLFNQNQTGDINLLTYDKIARNYLPHADIPRCNTTAVKIMEITRDLLGALQAKMKFLDSQIQTLNDEKKEFSILMSLFRKYQAKRKKFYQYILSNKQTSRITNRAYLNYDFAIKQNYNCTCLKQWIFRLYRSVFLNTISSLHQNAIYLKYMTAFLIVQVFFGFFLSLSSEVDINLSFRKEYLDQEETDPEVLRALQNLEQQRRRGQEEQIRENRLEQGEEQRRQIRYQEYGPAQNSHQRILQSQAGGQQGQSQSQFSLSQLSIDQGGQGRQGRQGQPNFIKTTTSYDMLHP